MAQSHRVSDWLALLALTAMWGSAFLLNELALRTYPPAVIVLARVVIAGVVLLAALRLGARRALPGPQGWPPLLLMALLGTILPFHLTIWAQQYIDSASTGVLMAVMPLFVLLLAHVLLPGERLSRARAVGFGCGFVGAVLVIAPAGSGRGDDPMALWGMLAVLTASFSYALNTIIVRRVGPPVPAVAATGMMLMACALALPTALLELPRVEWPPGGAATASVLLLGLLCTGVASVLYFRLIQGPGPAFLSLVNYLIPAWAVLAGALVLDETLAATTWLGLVLILFGVGFDELRRRLAPALVLLRRRWRAPEEAAVER